MKRSRGRGRKPSNPANRTYESNGPDVKIRGNATQIYDKYQQYARDAQTSGDRVNAENYLQHAEHYFRIIAANQPKDRPQDQNQSDQDNDDTVNDGANTSDDNDDTNDVAADSQSNNNGADHDSGEDRPRRNGRRRNYKRKEDANGDASDAPDAAKSDDDEGLRAMMARTGSSPEPEADTGTEATATSDA